jgi:four helix bundle protein
VKDFRELKVWSKSHELTLAIYRATRQFPSDERFGLTSQLRRAASSIGANLAEGCGRGSDANFARFVQISAGSASEVEYHLLLAHDLEMLADPSYSQLNLAIVEVKRMLTGLLKSLRKS